MWSAASWAARTDEMRSVALDAAEQKHEIFDTSVSVITSEIVRVVCWLAETDANVRWSVTRCPSARPTTRPP
jgi:hypothetical protein